MSKEPTHSETLFGLQDRRAVVERANEERAAARLERIAALTSPLLTIEERVQRWESLHGLPLPADPRHTLLRVIARDTSLAVDQIRAEQQRRKEVPASHGK